jgi:hypothetical protein
MKKTVWSNPDKQWEGFQLTRYSLDPNKVAALSITERGQVGGKQEDTPTTLEKGRDCIRESNSCSSIDVLRTAVGVSYQNQPFRLTLAI